MDIEAALKDGYSISEVNQEAAKRTGFNYSAARSDGYSDEDILGELRKRLSSTTTSNKPDTRSEALKALDLIQPPASLTPPEPEPSLTEKAYGVGEAAMETIARPLVSVPANLYGVFKQIKEGANPEKTAEELSHKILSSPKTKVGQKYTEAIGKVLDPLVGAGIFQSPSMMHQLTRPAIIKPPRDIEVTPGSLVTGKGKPLTKEGSPKQEIAAKISPTEQMELDLGQPNQFGQRPSDFILDENGIPVRKEASLEAQTTARQGDLFEGTRGSYAPEPNPIGSGVGKIEKIPFGSKEPVFLDQPGLPPVIETIDSALAKIRSGKSFDLTAEERVALNAAKSSFNRPELLLEDTSISRELQRRRESIEEAVNQWQAGEEFGARNKSDSVKQQEIEQAYLQKENQDRIITPETLQEPKQRSIEIQNPEARTTYRPNPQSVLNSFRKKQAGAIDPEVFKDVFDKVKNLANGLSLRARASDFDSLYVEAHKDGKRVGTAIFDPVKNEFGDFDLVSTDTGVRPDFQKQGIASEMYKFVSELGNDIKASPERTPEGIKMWQGFEKKGLSREGLILGRKQQGAWTPFARSEKVKDIPGIKEKLKYMMDPEFLQYEKARENLIGTPDIKEGQLRNNVMSGGQMMSQFFKNDLVTWSIGMIKSFAEQARIAVRDSEYEVKTAVNNLRKVAGEDTLIKVMNAMARGEELTPEALGVKGRELVETLQKVNDKTYEAINEEYKILSKGKELPKRDSYFNHSWSGPWGFEVRAISEAGNLVLIDVIREKTKGQAQQALEWTKKLNLEGVEISDLRYNSKFDKLYGKQDTGFFEESIQQLLNLSTEGSAKAKEAQQQFRDHFKHQTGVGGYLGNKPWKTPKENMVEALQSFYDYTNAANQWAAAKKSQRELNKFIEDEGIEAPNAKQLAQQYYNNAFGRNKQVLEIVDDMAEFMAKQVGISKGQVYSFVRNNKAFMTLLTLAYNGRFLLTQSLQPFQSVLPKMAEISGRAGQPTNIPLNFIMGFADSMGAWKFLPEGDIVRKYAEKSHVIDARVIQHLEGYDTKGRTWDFTEKTLSRPNNTVEKQTRYWAFSAIYRTAREVGLSVEDSLNLAKNQTETSMTSYESADRPLGYGKLGMVGETASNLQMYKHNSYTALVDYFKQAKNEKIYAPFIMTVAMQAFLAGTIGFYGWNELDSIFESLKKLDNSVTGGKLIGQLPSITEIAINNTPSVVSFGGLSTLTDADLSGGFSAGGILPDSPLQAVFPLLTKEIDMVRSGFEAIKSFDNKEDWGVFLQKSLPAMAQGKVAEHLLTSELPNGKKVKVRSTIDPSQRVAEVDNPDSRYYNSLSLGTRPLEVSKTNKLKFEDIRSERNIKERLNSVEDKILKAISAGDKEKTGKLYQQYLDFGGDPEDINPRLESYIRKRGVAEPLGQMLSDSESNSAALRNKRLIERFKREKK